MDPIKIHTGLAVPIDRANIDTDAIIPKQFLRKIERTGFGKHLFHEWRYLDYQGTKENSEFELNQPRYKDATVLLARDNFGCGSSREHAPWALGDYGFKVIIAPSFADIFYNNCIKNGILLIRLNADDVSKLFNEVLASQEGAQITSDLEKQIVVSPTGHEFKFEIDQFNKDCLLNGMDQIGWTQQFNDKIDSFEQKLIQEKSWMA